LNLARWTSDRNDQKLAKEVEAEKQAAENAGITGTPSFTIGRSNGTLIRFEPASLTDPKSFDEVIERL
jgi:predicted DsbA family dithiol-disulfide isomerase